MKLALSSFASSLVLALVCMATSVTVMAQGVSSSDGITVYNAQHASLTKAWVDAFTAETGIKVTVRNGEDTELGNQIVQEGNASPADLFLTENSPAMVLVDQAKLFAPVASDILAQVSENFRPSSGHWVGNRRPQHCLRLQQIEAAFRAAAEIPSGTR